jgi:PKD repeat protein
MRTRRFVVLLALVVGLSSALLLPGCVRFDGVVDFEADVLAGKKPLPVQFTLLVQGCIESCLWSFGDGAFSQEHNPVHTYEQAGSYTVIVTVTPCGGEPVSARKDDYITVTSGFGSGPATMWCYYGDTESNRIWCSELVSPFEGQNSGRNEVLNQTIGVPHDFALVGTTLFWTDQAARKIFSADVSPAGSDDVSLVGTCEGVPYGLAIDPALGKVYWAENDLEHSPLPIQTIMRANFDGTGSEHFIYGAADREDESNGDPVIVDLAFDGVERNLYSIFDPIPLPWIRPCYILCTQVDSDPMDQESQTVVREEGPITDIAIDQIGRKVYWYNSRVDEIRRASIAEDDTAVGAVETIVSGVPGVADLAIDEQDQRIVWITYRDGVARIMSAALDGSDIRYRLGSAMTAHYTAITIGPRPAWSPADVGD